MRSNFAMRIVFMGSAELSCACLDALFRNDLGGPRVDVVGIVCQPDRPKGRSLHVAACPVKERVCAGALPVLTPVNVNAPESLDAIRLLSPDAIVVVAYGQILGKKLLELPPLGCINIHASLLPAYRGAAPIQWSIVRGEAVTGVTAMYMAKRMDAGDIILQRSIRIGPEDTGGMLHEAIAREGPIALMQSLTLVDMGEERRIPQDERLVTFAPKLGREDGRIDWTLAAVDIYNRVRGFNPWPGCFCELDRGSGAAAAIKIWKCRVESGTGGAAGVVLGASGEGPLVAAGSGAVRLLEVQPEGRKAMTGSDYLRGYHVAAGSRMIVRSLKCG